MTKITPETITRLANLANLNLSQAETDKYAQEIESIIGYIDQLLALDLDEYSPTISTTNLQNVTRPDIIADNQLSTAELLANAPAQLDDQFKVEKVL